MSFPSTAWQLLDDVRAKSAPNAESYRAAINRLTCLYWRPVYGFLRARGQTHEAAEELTQEFWLWCFEKRVLSVADPQRGRFRSFLLAVLKNFVADHSPDRQRRQSAFEVGLVPVSVLARGKEEESACFEPAQSLTPDEIFMRRWAESLILAVGEQLRMRCIERGRTDWYVIFERFHFPPPGSKRPSQEELAASLGVSRDQIRYALDQTGDQFGHLLREMLADQVTTPAELNSELVELERLLGRR